MSSRCDIVDVMLRPIAIVAPPRGGASVDACRPPGPLLTGAAAVLLAVLFAGSISRKMPDLEVYWTAAAGARR